MTDRPATAEEAEHVRLESRLAQASRALARRAPAVRGAASRSKTRAMPSATGQLTTTALAALVAEALAESSATVEAAAGRAQS